jgi:hypothetical protein
MLEEASNDNVPSLIRTCEWFKRFNKGRMSFDDDDRSGRPSTEITTEDVAKLCEAILEEIHYLCEIVNCRMERVSYSDS